MNAQDIRNIRMYNGITQKDFCELFGVPVGTWSNVERGAYPLYEDMKVKAIKALKDLGCDFSVLQKGIEYPVKPKPRKTEPYKYGRETEQPQVEEKQVENLIVTDKQIVPDHIRADFAEIAIEIAEILTRKNNDYGDSFFNVYKEFGDLSTFIRLQDKMGRLASMVKGNEMLVEGESRDDVYRDIAGYCILTLHAIKTLKGKGE